MSIVVLWTWLHARLSAEKGAGMVEYGLLVGLLAVVALAAVKTFGAGVSTQFSSIHSAVN